MKLRSGFVSNSSSSSFIVAFDGLPNYRRDLQELLFGDEKTWSMYDYTFDTKTISEVVWRDIQAQLDELPYAFEEIADDMCNVAYEEMYYKRVPLHIPGLPPELAGAMHTSEPIREHWTRFEKGEKRDAERRLQEKELRDRQERMAKEFLDKNDGKVVLRFLYSDNDGELFSVMEHGDIFQKLAHVRISKH
jgi:hypothetical protein